MRKLVSASLFVVAGAALFGTLSACGEDRDDAMTEDALYAYAEPDAPRCRADDETPASLPFKPPQPIRQGVCTPAQVEEIVRCKVTPAIERGQWDEPSITACKLFDRNPANLACRTCAVTETRAGIYGALIDDRQEAVPNVAGCIARFENDLTANGCGAAVQAAAPCRAIVRARCAASCPSEDRADCIRASEDAICGSILSRATCRGRATAAGGLAAACDPAGDRYARARAMVHTFCGP